LPLVCVKCGQLADDTKPVTFSMHPGWMHILVLACVVPWLVAAFLLRRTATVDLPICRKHRRNLGFKTAMLTVLVPAIVLLIFSVVGLPYLLNSRGIRVEGIAFCVLPMLLFVLLTIAAIVNRSGVRPTAITDRGITLKGVHPHFADIVRELRDAKYDE
jgi:hypothetical protein